MVRLTVGEGCGGGWGEGVGGWGGNGNDIPPGKALGKSLESRSIGFSFFLLFFSSQRLQHCICIAAAHQRKAFRSDRLTIVSLLSSCHCAPAATPNFFFSCSDSALRTSAAPRPRPLSPSGPLSSVAGGTAAAYAVVDEGKTRASLNQ